MKALTGTLPCGTSPTLCHEHSVAVADPVRPYPRDTGFFCRSFAAVVSVPLSQPHSFDAEMALPRPQPFARRRSTEAQDALQREVWKRFKRVLRPGVPESRPENKVRRGADPNPSNARRVRD